MKRLSITIEPEMDKKLQEGDYNKSKLINRLLKEYLRKQPKIRNK